MINARDNPGRNLTNGFSLSACVMLKYNARQKCIDQLLNTYLHLSISRRCVCILLHFSLGIVLSRYLFRTFSFILNWLACDGVLGWCIFCPFQKALFQGEFIAEAWHLWKKGTNTKRYKCPKWFKTTTYCLISWQLRNGAWHNNANPSLQPISASQFHPESAILCIKCLSEIQPFTFLVLFVLFL